MFLKNAYSLMILSYYEHHKKKDSEKKNEKTMKY